MASSQLVPSDEKRSIERKISQQRPETFVNASEKMMLEVIWRKIKDKMYTAQKKIMISFSLRQIPPTKRIKALHIRKYHGAAKEGANPKVRDLKK